MNEKSQQLYNYLKSNGLTDLDANTFFSKYSDPNKSKEVWSYLKNEGMTDLDADSFYSSYFKKKSQDTTASTSGTGLSGSSDVEIFTGYPGKEEKPYKFKNGKWYEESGVKIYGQKEAQYAQITDPNRIKNLNRQFKKDASLSQQEQVFSNYDEEKKDNLYRINNNQWERKTPGSKFVPIKNEGSINALNKRYGQSVGTKIVSTTTLPPKDFKDITSSFVGKTEEKAIDYLTKKINEAERPFLLSDGKNHSSCTQNRAVPTRHRTPDGPRWRSRLALDVGEGQKQTRCIDSPVRRRGGVNK
jgi:hypothetical protein